MVDQVNGKPRKNILGYSKDEMEASKKRSKYFAGLAFIFLLIIAVINADSGIVPMLGFMLAATVIAQILAWVVRMFAKIAKVNINRFDCFATTYLVLTTLALISMFVPV